MDRPETLGTPMSARRAPWPPILRRVALVVLIATGTALGATWMQAIQFSAAIGRIVNRTPDPTAASSLGATLGVGTSLPLPYTVLAEIAIALALAVGIALLKPFRWATPILVVWSVAVGAVALNTVLPYRLSDGSEILLTLAGWTVFIGVVWWAVRHEQAAAYRIAHAAT